jgi:hypothetical protein
VKLALLVPLVRHFGLLGAALSVCIASALEHGSYVKLTIRHLGLTWRQVGDHVWRSACACVFMALALWTTNLGWAHPTDNWAAWESVLLAVPLGALVYSATTIGFWFAAGRPTGAERDLAQLAQAIIAPARRVLRQVQTRTRALS